MKNLLPLSLLFAFLILPFQGQAHEFVSSHKLECTKEFPCFPELKPRIEFWIEVFSRYRNNQAIFHDGEVPQRVYAVVDGLSCSGRSRKGSRKVKRERGKWKGILQDLARKTETAQEDLSPDETHVLHLFEDPSGDDLREAASSVRCQQGNKDRFARGLPRYGAYREFIVKALKDKGLSTEIQYLPFVESAFNPQAYSRVGAAGLWQIMPRTARLLGLKMGIHSDERLDPYHATQAAALYLKNAYETLRKVPTPKGVSSKDKALGPFVITSYNYGTGGVKKALKRFGPDFVKVLHEYEGRRFRTAVRNFYVSFLAARHVARNSAKYFPEVVLLTPEKFKTFRLQHSISASRLQKQLAISQSAFKELNPSLTRWVWNEGFLIPKGHQIKVPQTTDTKKLVASLKSLPPEHDPWRESVEYRVRRGDFPCQIARTFRVSCKKLMALNGIGRRGYIRVGQRLRIPPRAGSSKPTQVAAVSTPEPTPKPTVEPVQPEATPVVQPAEPSLTPVLPTQIPSIPIPQERVAIGPKLPEKSEVEIHPDEFDVHKKGNRYFVYVEYEETLGHFADWLDLGFATPLRRLNRLTYGKPIQPGQAITLPIKNEEQLKEFETRRLDYHHSLQSEFFTVFEVESTQVYRVQRGDTAWSISGKFEVPQWLLKRENPLVFKRGLRPRDSIKIPVLKRVETGTNGVLRLKP